MWLRFDSPTPADSKGIGDRAYKLLFARSLGIRVPRFGVLTSQFVKEQKKNPTTLENQFESIEQELKTWAAHHFVLRISLEFGDEHIASSAVNLNSQSGIPLSELKTALLSFHDKINREDVRNFFHMHSGERGEKQDVAIIIQEHISAIHSGFYFQESPTISSGLHYMESQNLANSQTSAIPETEICWCDPQGTIWKRSGNGNSLSPDSKLLKNHLEWGALLAQKSQGNFSFEWNEDENGQCYLLGWQNAASNEEALENYTRIPMKGVLLGNCSNLSVDIWKKICGSGLQAAETSVLGQSIKANGNWLEFFAGRPYLSFDRLRPILNARDISPTSLGIQSARSEKEKPAHVSFLANFSRLRKLKRAHRAIRSQAKTLLKEASRLIIEHRNILEHLQGSRETARLIANLIDSLPNPSSIFVNELNILESKEILLRLCQVPFPGLPLNQMGKLHQSAEKGLKIFESISTLTQQLAENPEFLKSIEHFLASTSESGQSGDIYYWLRESGYHRESVLIHDFLQIFGKISFYDRRVESPCLMLSPTTFFQILLRISKSGLETKLHAAEKLESRNMHSSFWDNWIAQRAERILSESIELRTEASEMVDEALYVVRNALRSMAVFLQSESPKIFPDQDAAPELSYLGLDTIRDYGNGSFGADVLQQLLGRSLRTDVQAPIYPDQFLHRKSEGDPYFLNAEVQPEAQKVWVVADPERLLSNNTRFSNALYLDDPRDLGQLGQNESEIVASEAAIPGLALFVSPKQKYIITPQYDLDWVLFKLRILGLHTSVLSSIPQALRADKREIAISVDDRLGVEFR